jgi:NAD(P)-dependent dehydrogenase (short-subunit alcohol dehydrogenase family)
MLNTKGLFNLGGKVALVTGGGAGLGREFCDVLAEFGADVVCCDLRGDRAQETSGIIGRHGHQTLAVKVDVSEYDQVQAVFRRVEETFGHLDVLVNNAGITTRSTVIEEVEIAEWQKLLNVNLSSVFYCMKEGLRLMARQKRGTVINITSILGLYGSDPGIFSKAAYAASKAGIIGLTREGAAEYGRYGILSTASHPAGSRVRNSKRTLASGRRGLPKRSSCRI